MKSSIRQTVIRSLSAVGALQEAQFYAELFAAQAPERFALVVLDPRCLKNPLLEALVSDLRILADLGLTPVLLVGAMESDATSNKFQTQRLHMALDAAGVRSIKLNMATYALIEEVKTRCKQSRMPILEMTDNKKAPDLQKLITLLNPAKVIFLQPSGGISRKGERIPVINIDAEKAFANTDVLTQGQDNFVKKAKALIALRGAASVYIMASPLNLLAELFTTKGSGTMIRSGATFTRINSYAKIDRKAVEESMESAFEKPLNPQFFQQKISDGFIETAYRGGAIFTQASGLNYLSKFWVVKEARGEGIARDIWEAAVAEIPVFYWRSRMENPFNDWYLRNCDGMQIIKGWRVFWKGLSAPQVSEAITAASRAPEDFKV
jgi:acetylglutamate kinase